MSNSVKKSISEIDQKYSYSSPSAHCDKDKYEQMYQESINDPEKFWAEQASIIDWNSKWSKVKETHYSKKSVDIKWYKDASLNVCYNCIDRHLENKADKTAIIWEGDNPEESRNISYEELHKEVCRFANVLKARGVKKGDVVTIYLPMIPEAAYAMLACARIGAVHSVVFGGFSPEALNGRIKNCDSKLVITADAGVRGGKFIPLKANADKAIESLNDVDLLVVNAKNTNVSWAEKQNYWYHEEAKNVNEKCEIELMDSEDPLFILYTSGSTGKPKGVLHSSGGYLVYAAMTHKYVFDYQENDIYWCTADVGWVTGHSYILYGPLANGATTLMFEGVPNYPDASRFWQVVQKHKVTQFYTAPTAIRALMGLGNDFINKADLSSLRILGSVGEPINPEAWRWYHEVVGKNKCPIVDTWWQTETGGFLITALPYATELKAGSATLPFFGVQPAILDTKNGEELHGEAEGALCIKDSWPGQMRTVIGDHQRFIDTYFSQYDGYYFSGDGAKRDAGGNYWITGRMDDVINVSGHRLGTAEIESALVAHPKVSEAAVVGYPHEIKGQGIYIYVTTNKDVTCDKALHDDLISHIRQQIGAFAKPDYIHFTPELPKTRSGKIMRRILRKIAENDLESLGDTSTLLNPKIVDELIDNKKI